MVDLLRWRARHEEEPRDLAERQRRLVRAMAHDDPEAVVRLLAGLGEADRRALSREVLVARRIRVVEPPATTAALLGTLPGLREVRRELAWRRVDPAAADAVAAVLRDRAPRWLDGLAEALAGGQASPSENFLFLRRLVRAGVLAVPDVPEYVLGMVGGLLDVDRAAAPEGALESAVRSDPGLIEGELWTLLHTERSGRFLSTHDAWAAKGHEGPKGSYPARPDLAWRHVILALVADGTYRRDAVLGVAVEASLRDWAAVDIPWFVQLHDALAPTVDELAERQGRYGALLAAPAGASVHLGLRSLSTLLDAGRLDVDALLSGARATLLRQEKSTVERALRLLAAAATAHPGRAGAVASVVATATEHPRADVRELVGRLLTRLGSTPSDGVEPFAAGGVTVAEHGVPSRRAPAAAVAPVADADELAELLAHLIEEADDPAEVERALEGLARLAGHRPRVGADALARRAARQSASTIVGGWADVRRPLAIGAVYWLAPPPATPMPITDAASLQARRRQPHVVAGGPPEDARTRTLPAMISGRWWEVMGHMIKGGGPMLALPTTTDGRLSLDALLSRLDRLGPGVGGQPFDIVQAFLRLSPEDRRGLVDRIGPDALRGARADGGLAALATLGDLQPRWRRHCADSRAPWGGVAAGVVTWSDEAAYRGPLQPLSSVLDRSAVWETAGYEVRDGEDSARPEQAMALWTLVLPHEPDLLASHAHPALHAALETSKTGTGPVLLAIGASARPLGAPSCSALLLGLAARAETARAIAADAVVDAATGGVLDGRVLGNELGALLRDGHVRPARLVAGLREAARGAGAAASVVLDALVVALPEAPGRRETASYLELLGDLATAAGRQVTVPAELAAAPRSSAVGRAVRRIPSTG